MLSASFLIIAVVAAVTTLYLLHKRGITLAMIAKSITPGHMVVAVMLFALVMMGVTPPTPAMAQASFSIDVNSFLSSASQMFNGIFPIFAPIIGISLGIGLASFIAKRFEWIV